MRQRGEISGTVEEPVYEERWPNGHCIVGWAIRDDATGEVIATAGYLDEAREKACNHTARPAAGSKGE